MSLLTAVLDGYSSPPMAPCSGAGHLGMEVKVLVREVDFLEGDRGHGGLFSYDTTRGRRRAVLMTAKGCADDWAANP